MSRLTAKGFAASAASMVKYGLLLCGLGLLAVPVLAAPAGLSSRIEAERSTVGVGEDVTLRYTLHNDSAQDLRVLYWQTPLRGIFNDLFDVRLDGQPVRYVGRLSKWATPHAEDFILVPAGGEVSASVELSSAYEIAKSGEYTINYRLRPREAMVVLDGSSDDARGVNVDAAAVRSNSVSLSIERDEAAEALRAQPFDFDDDAAARVDPMYVTPGYVSCSSSRQTTLRSALGAAETMSGKGKAYLARGTHDSGYTTWFGTYTASNYSKVTTHFNNIYGVFNSKTVTFYCDCTEAGTYAYVYANQPYKIHLCGAFWSAPLTGIDSKGGTLVHECSHFTVVASTDDWAYGTAGCQGLSTAKKIDNADCHEYFAETK